MPVSSWFWIIQNLGSFFSFSFMIFIICSMYSLVYLYISCSSSPRITGNGRGGMSPQVSSSESDSEDAALSPHSKMQRVSIYFTAVTLVHKEAKTCFCLYSPSFIYKFWPYTFWYLLPIDIPKSKVQLSAPSLFLRLCGPDEYPK